MQEPSAAVSFRKVLVVYQFAITISLIAFTDVAYQQVRYMLQQDLGVQVDGTLVVWGPMGLNWNNSFKSRMLAFEKEVKNIPGVKEVTNSKNVPGDQLGKVPGVKQKGQMNGNTLAATWVGNTFFDLYGLPLIAGRTFIPADTSQNKVVLNQSALKVLGFREPQEAIGKKLDSSEQEMEIVGVVSDHHQQSLHSLIEPILFRNGAGQDGYFSVKLSNKNLPETLAQVKALYLQFFSGASFEYFFLEEYFDQQYRTEHLLIPLIRTFSFFAIFISCLGLWGLVLHAFTRRTKEIGIRKVLGASLNQIVMLLSKDFLKLVIIAFVLATPVAYYALYHWLQDFAYHIDISWGAFALAGGAVLGIALLTISFQAVKAAAANPVHVLRSE